MPEPREADYDEVIESVRGKLRVLGERIERDKARVEARYTDLIDQPEGRQATVIDNSPPTMLLALAHRLIRESYAHRFDDAARSLALASLAHRAAKAVKRSGYLSQASASDLIGESLDYLANAHRVNSDLVRAELAFAEAGRHLEDGTRDRQLRANHLGLLGALRNAQGRVREAAEMWGREAALWRLLKDREKLGSALINCGLATCYAGGALGTAAEFIRRGSELVEDDRVILIGFLTLAELFAREGDGVRAWKLLCSGDIVAITGGVTGGLMRRQRWVKGIVYRALGEPDRAARLFEEVRDEFEEVGQPLLAAFVSLDLLAVLAAQGRQAELVQLAEAAYEIFVAEGLEQQALSVFMIARQAAADQQLTEELAIKVANFIQRRQHNREARFE